MVCRASAGTGKTFTLAAYYIAMLLSGESYRNILAVTFTNAATAEMKERILTYLIKIAHGQEEDFFRLVRTYMLRDNDASDEVLRARAETNLHAILQDYDNFSVSTIDSFLQQLIRGMAQALNRTADFEISLDLEQVITKAVDTMLSSELTDDSKRTVFDYITQRLADGKGWDIRKGLIKIGMQLYEENVQIHGTSISAAPLVLDEQRIDDYRKTLYAQRNAALEQFKALVTQANRDREAGVEYAKTNVADNAIENMLNSIDKLSAMKKDLLFRGATELKMDAMLADPQLRK